MKNLFVWDCDCVNEAAQGSYSTCAHQHVVGRGVPAQDAHTFGVTVQLHHGVCERRGQASVRDLPDLSITGHRLERARLTSSQPEFRGFQ